MHLPPQESIEQLQFELNDTKGRLDALSFMARIILDSVKLQDEEAYQALKTACLTYSHDHLATLGEIGEDDIEKVDEELLQGWTSTTEFPMTTFCLGQGEGAPPQNARGKDGAAKHS